MEEIMSFDLHSELDFGAVLGFMVSDFEAFSGFALRLSVCRWLQGFPVSVVRI